MSDKIISYRDLVVWQRAIELEDMKAFEQLAASTGQLAHGLFRSLDR